MLGRTFLLEFVSLQSKECGCVEQRVWVTAKGVEDDEIVDVTVEDVRRDFCWANACLWADPNRSLNF